MRENDIDDIRRRVSRVFANRDFRESVANSGKDNWLHISVDEAFERVQKCLERIEEKC